MATTDDGLHFNLDNANDDNERYDDDLVNLKNCLNNCVYYTDSEVNNLHQQLCRDITLSTLTVNCRSLPKNFDKLEYTMKSLDFNFDCIGLTETWLKDNEETNIYNMSGYTLLSKTRAHKRGGGVGLYISDRLKYKTRDDLIAVTEECPFECLFIEAEVDKNAIVIGTVYKPPDTNVNTFNDHFKDLLRKISNERKKCIIMADFNIDLLKIDTNGQTTDFIHGMFASTFYPTISRPTRVTQQTATLIDNIITNMHEYPVTSGILYNDISDHFPVFNFYSMERSKRVKYTTVYRRKASSENINKLNIKIQNLNWDEVYTDSDPCTAYGTFLNILESQIKECLPLKKLKIKAYKSDWLSKGILISCKQNNLLFKKFKQNPTIEIEATYKTYKNKLTHIIRQSKKMHFKNKFELYKKDCRKTWNTINEVLKSKNKKHMVNDKFTTSEGTSITDKNEIVEQFNKYFTNIGSSLNSKLPKTGEDPIQHIKHNTASFFCAPTDPTEIINIVKSGNSSKSSGVDNIDPYVVQKIIPQIANQLAHIFNKSLQTGIVPDKLKIAKVIPLYKNDNPEQFKNYRPISILPCFSKIIERIMYNRLYSFLTKHNIISEKQYGFRKKYATYMALIDLVDKISSNFDEKKYTVGVFLDLSKAFDTIDHTILINKLQCYGVRGSACNWFVSYLQNRKQYVVYNKTESECKDISCGVPQGSILGPLLFILYINDIENVSDIIKPILFADDTSLFHSHTCFNTLIQEVNIQLHKFSTWFNTNKLSLNTKKTNFIIFTPIGKNTILGKRI